MDGRTHAGNYQLRKRNRFEEENLGRQYRPWTKYIIDVEQKKFLGYTRKGWVQLTIFCLIFAILLCGFFALYYYLYSLSFSDEKPTFERLQPEFSMIPKNLNRRVEYFDNDMNDINPYVNSINNFLQKGMDTVDNHFKDCNPNHFYGFRKRQPCVFLKLNRILYFKPNTYETYADLPEGAPKQLKYAMESVGNETNNIWASCEARNSDELKFEFYPRPYWISDNLMSDKPLIIKDAISMPAFYRRTIAVKLLNVKLNKLINVVCKAWAKNIEVDGTKPNAGWVSFRILIKTGNYYELEKYVKDIDFE